MLLSGLFSLAGVQSRTRTLFHAIYLGYFLQKLMVVGRNPSTLKVYVAAIAVHHFPVVGQSLVRSDLVVRFLKGARRLNSPRHLTYPLRISATVAELWPLSLKTAKQLSLASVE